MEFTKKIFLLLLPLLSILHTHGQNAIGLGSSAEAGTLSEVEVSAKAGTQTFNNSNPQQLNNLPAGRQGSLNGNDLCFTPNKGQIAGMNGKLCPDILYKGSGDGADIYLRKTGISYVYSNLGEVQHEVDEQVEELIQEGAITEADEHKRKEELMQKENIKIHRVDMDFANCNENIKQLNEDEADGYNNYYYAHCPQGITNVKQYNKVTYKNIYNNIDVSYYGSGETGIKYDLIVQPHADPGQIKLHWKGAESIHLSRGGNLVIKTSVNEFYESIPRVYQIINGEIIDVKAEYKLSFSPEFIPTKEEDRAGNGLVTFQLGTWNPELPLIIDPSTWITYYGGNNRDIGHSATTDNFGNAIFSGYTFSLNFPKSVGPYQGALAGNYDAFVVKMNPSGAMVFATYFGGTGVDYAYGIDADTNNDIYITGETTSFNLPIMAWGGAFMQAINGGSIGSPTDAFVSKFSAAGALIWSTYYGGSGSNGDSGRDIVTDAANNIIFTGITQSSDFPFTLGAFQIALGSVFAKDAFVVKFDNTGIRQWATYYGGSSVEAGCGIAVDAAKNIYVCGQTYSANFPTAGIFPAFQPVLNGFNDAFLIRLNPINGFPDWSTFYGGTIEDYGYAIAADALGNIFLGMWTLSPAGVTTVGAYQTVRKGASDGAIIKFTNTGSRVWATYLGGSVGPVAFWGGQDYITGLDVDVNNNIVAGGDTYSTDFPVTSCAYQTTFQGTENQFISTFNQQGELICSTYLGIGNSSSPNNETFPWFGGSIAVTGGFVCLTGATTCTYPVTAGAFQTACGGNWDATFSKLCLYICGKPNTTASFSGSTNVCVNSATNFTLTNTSCDIFNTTYLWTFAGSTQGTSTAQNPSGITWSNPGKYSVSVKVMGPCDTITVTQINYITINPCGCALSSGTTVVPATCGNSNGVASVTAIGGSGSLTYVWSNGQTTQTSSGLVPGNYTVTVRDAGGCSTSATATIISPPELSALFTKGTANCANCGCKEWIMVTATGGTSPYSYTWPDGYNNRYKNHLCPGNYNINIKDKNGCSVNVNLTAP